jgi:hypothetical protein
MARRVRTTVTLSEDDNVPRRRSRKKSNAVWIILLFVLLGLFLMNRTRQAGVLQPQPTPVRR